MRRRRRTFGWIDTAIIIAFTIVVLLIFFSVSTKSSAKAEDNDTWLSPEIQSYCEEIGMEYGICPELFEAMIEAESSGNAGAVNGSCKGLMQVNVPCHRDRMKRLSVDDIYDEEQNIRVAADYLLELFEEYEDPGLVLMKYNGTSNAAERAERGDYTCYARKILKRSYELERIHEK